MKNNYSLGKGIAVAGMWIGIAIMFVSALNFVEDIWFRDDYREPPPKVPEDCDSGGARYVIPDNRMYPPEVPEAIYKYVEQECTRNNGTMLWTDGKRKCAQVQKYLEVEDGR